MNALMVGPVILWVIVSLYLVKKKGKQWPELVWGLAGGLILAKLMPALANTMYNVTDQIWNAIVSFAQSITG